MASASASDLAELRSGKGSARDRAEAHAPGRKRRHKKAGRMKRKGGRR